MAEADKPAGGGSPVHPPETILRLEAMFEGAPIGLVVLDTDLVVRRSNDAARGMSGGSAAPGARLSSVHPFGGELAVLAEAALHGAAIREVDLEDGAVTASSWEVSCFPLGDPGERAGVAVVLVDCTVRHQFVRLVEAQRESLRLIADGRPLPDVLLTLTRAIERLAGGGMLASVLLLDDEGRLHHGAAPSLPQRYCELIDGVAIGPDVGSCGTAAWSGARVVVEDIETDPRWADFRFAAEDFGLRACWSTPIMSGAGTVLGTFAAYYREPRAPSDDDLSLIDVFSRTASLAVERHQADEAREAALLRERAARADAEDARADLRWLTGVSEALTASFSDPESVRELATRAVPRLGDLCVVDLLEDGVLTRAAVVHADPAAARLAERLARYRPTAESSHPVAKALATGEAVVVERVSDTGLFALSGEHEQLLQELELSYWVCLPLHARGSTFGVLSVVGSRSGREISTRDLDLCHALARRAAPAIDNARLYARQVDTVTALQQALLPPRLPATPGLDVAASYQAGAPGVDVGGDVYDLFEVPGGWAFLVGDVSGRGPGAAAATGRVRDTARAVARFGHSPAEVVVAVNEALLGTGEDERFVTLAFGRVTATADGVVGEVISAGHPPPWVVRASGSLEPLAAEGVLLGQVPVTAPSPVPFRLGPGDALVTVTDGVLEARRDIGAAGVAQTELFADEALAPCLRSLAGASAAEIARALPAAAVGFAGGRVDDDIAVLVIAAERSGSSA